MNHIDPRVAEARAQAQAQWNANPCGALPTGEYDRDYFAKVEAERFRLQYWQKDFFDYTSFRGGRVLEIGVGLGTDLKQFARNGATCVGVDITDTHLELTRLNFRQEGYEVELRKGDATHLPFPDGYFDCVYSFGVIHHIPDADRVIAEVQRVLRPGGTFQVSLYHLFSIHTVYLFLHALLKGRLWTLGVAGVLATIESGADGITVKPYVKLYSLRRLKNLLRAQGLLPSKTGVRHVYFQPSWLNAFRMAESALGWYVCAIARKPV